MKSIECEPMAEESYFLPASVRGPLFYPKLSGRSKAWFALYVQVKHEKDIIRRLEQKAVDCFLPLMECWSKRRDRRKRITVPLFPGYLFVYTVLDNYTNVDILKTPGAVNIVRSSEGPLPIPAYQIRNLRTILGASQSIELHPYLKEGECVRVVRGPLNGCVGILKRHSPKQGRLVVRVDCIQRSVSVELDVEDVEAAEPPREGRTLS